MGCEKKIQSFLQHFVPRRCITSEKQILLEPRPKVRRFCFSLRSISFKRADGCPIKILRADP